MTARLYGKRLGYGSLATVMRGFEGALTKAGLLRGIYAVDEAGSFVDGECPTDGADARYGVYVGPLGAVGQMFERGKHEHHFVMVTPNSDQLPESLVREIAGYQDRYDITLMAPSAWAAVVVAKFLPAWPILIVPHGVSLEYRVLAELSVETRRAFQENEFRVLHLSTSARQRKGTLELIQGWQSIPRAGKLLCVMDYPARLALEEALLDGEAGPIDDSIKIVDRADLPPERMARSLARSHVVCQPSRGEGFGLVPLEALACGVPVVATAVTGHTEYLSRATPGAVIIGTTKDLRPIDDLPGSRAPAVDPMDVALALVRARTSWLELQRAALDNAHIWRSNWSWEASLEPFIERLKNVR